MQSDFAAFLAIMSLGIGAVTFRKRPSRHRGVPTPGVAAMAAAVSVMVIQSALGVGLIARRNLWAQQDFGGWVEYLHGEEFSPATTGTAIAGAILGTWSYLAVAGAYRARDDWRDWLGRWVGWAWLSQVGLHSLFAIIWG